MQLVLDEWIVGQICEWLTDGQIGEWVRWNEGKQDGWMRQKEKDNDSDDMGYKWVDQQIDVGCVRGVIDG